MRRKAGVVKMAARFARHFLPNQLLIPAAAEFWKCESSLTTFRLDYTYTPDVFPSTSKPNLTGLAVTVTVGGGVTKSESVPEGAWSASKNVMAWKLPNVEASGNVGK